MYTNIILFSQNTSAYQTDILDGISHITHITAINDHKQKETLNPYLSL